MPMTLSELQHEAVTLEGLCQGAEVLWEAAQGEEDNPDTKHARNALHVFLPMLSAKAGELANQIDDADTAGRRRA